MDLYYSPKIRCCSLLVFNGRIQTVFRDTTKILPKLLFLVQILKKKYDKIS